MKTQIKKPDNVSRVIQSKTKAANQAPVSKILQAYKNRTAQREALPDEDELLQGKFETTQLMDFDDDEEPLQGKFVAQLRKEAVDWYNKHTHKPHKSGKAPKLLPKQIEKSITINEEFILKNNLHKTREELTEEETIQLKNNTGLPDGLKSGVENLSGISINDVRVHYNSPKPAQLHALAYTQGTDIHVAPRQEKHLPHEAWHVVQQKQGRVQPTIQLQGININDNEGLEREADVMGGKAIQMKSPVQLAVGVHARPEESPEYKQWDTYSTFDKKHKLHDNEHNGNGGQLTVFLIPTGLFDHRVVALEWYDGEDKTGQELVAHLATEELAQGSLLSKIGKQIFSPFYSMPSIVRRMDFRQDAVNKKHKTICIGENRKEEIRNRIENAIDEEEHTYNLYTYNCKTWANEVAPEAII